MEISLPILLVIIGLSSLGAQWIAWLLRLPAILPLLVCGVVLGPLTHILSPDDMFGELLFPLISLSVAIILFEGALSLRRDDVRGLAHVVRHLTSTGMITTFCVTALACWLILGVSPEIAALSGAVTVVTGPTVIAPLMRVIRPTPAVNNVLRWEGIIIDPVGAIFTLLVYEFITLQNGSDNWIHLALTFSKTIMSGFTIGIFCGWFLATSIRKSWFPVYLKNFSVLIIVISGFGFSNAIADESGLLAVTVAGIWLANAKNVDTSDILAFKEELSAILISALFIILSARLNITAIGDMGWPLLLLIVIIQFIGRPLCIAVSTFKSTLTFREKLFLSWIAPRGIVAAAVSSLFTLTLEKNGYTDASQLTTIVFAVIIGTVVLQSLTGSLVATLLEVKAEKPRGVLIAGADLLGRSLAIILQQQNIPVQIADDNWENCRLARMAGLQTYYGNPWSEHAENVLDLSQTANIFALSSERHWNALSVYHFSHTIGSANALAIRTEQEQLQPGDKEGVRFRRHERLFGKDVTWSRLTQHLVEDGTIKATRLSDNFGWKEYLEKNIDIIPLLIINNEGVVVPVTDGILIQTPCILIAMAHNIDS